jgi:putative membrane protein
MFLIEMIVHVIVTAFLLTVVARLISGMEVRNGSAALWAAIAFGLVNFFIRPIILFLTFPINLLTLGLFTIVINALMLMLAAVLVDGFEVKNFKAAVFGTLSLSVLNFIVSKMFSILL